MTSIKIENKTDFRAPSVVKRLPRAVADAAAGIIIAVADGLPEAVFHALKASGSFAFAPPAGFTLDVTERRAYRARQNPMISSRRSAAIPDRGSNRSR
jgi:hypothetical protein